jgi:hypothetical protein
VHHSGSGWLARPFPWGTCTSYSLPAFLAHSALGHERRIKPTLRRQVDPRQQAPPAASVASGSGKGQPPAPFERTGNRCKLYQRTAAGRAEVLSINRSVGAHGEPAFFKNHEALSAAYRHKR